MAKKRISVQRPQPAKEHRFPAKPETPLRRLLPWIGGGVLFVLVAAALLWLARPSTSEGAPGERMPIQGQQHIEFGQTHPPYNSDPPTSGWRYPEALPADFYEVPQPDELVVHNLEHGHIVISYDCRRLADCASTKAELKRIFNTYSGWKVTVVPRENQDAAIALTAWGWIDKLDAFDEARIRRFVDAWRNRGPEATME